MVKWEKKGKFKKELFNKEELETEDLEGSEPIHALTAFYLIGWLWGPKALGHTGCKYFINRKLLYKDELL